MPLPPQLVLVLGLSPLPNAARSRPCPSLESWPPALHLAKVTHDNALAHLLPAPSHTLHATTMLPSLPAFVHGGGEHEKAGA